jgi:hypothetical protein
MSAEKLYSEIFEDFDKCTTRTERVNLLRKHGDHRFKNFLFFALSPVVVFDVEVPKYRPAVEPAGLNYTYLDSEVSKLYRFIKGHPKRPQELTGEKQKQLLVVILESLHKDEADLLVRLIKKDLKIKHLTTSLLIEAFPDLA